jgi:sulfur-oxidizing protein SoxZ
MANSIKIRAKLKGDVTQVKALISHPMETGARKDEKSGEVVPAYFIQEVVCTWKGKEVMKALWSGGVSKNPYISFKFTGAAKGDTVQLAWTDNKGESDSAEAEIK